MGLLRCRGVGVLVTTRGPQKPSLGKVKSSVDEDTTGELRWEKPDARKGKEITEVYGKHNRTGNGENINRSTILSRRGTQAKKREQRWDRIEASMWEKKKKKKKKSTCVDTTA